MQQCLLHHKSQHLPEFIAEKPLHYINTLFFGVLLDEEWKDYELITTNKLIL